jgi:GAF domain
MRSRAATVTVGGFVLAVVGAALLLIVQLEKRASARRDTLRELDTITRQAETTLADLRAAQQAYVATGQSLGLWMSKVEGAIQNVTARIAELQHRVSSAEAQAALSDAVEAVAEIRAVDKRARQYLHTDQTLMAGDVVFSEGAETSLAAAQHLEAARQAEYLAADAEDETSRRFERYAAGAAAATIVLSLLALAWAASTAPSRQPPQEVRPTAAPPSSAQTPAGAAGPAVDPSQDLRREHVAVLAATAKWCAGLNRARDAQELVLLLEQAASMLEASGVVVWIANLAGTSLRPVLAHGYSAEALAHLPHVARAEDNAAAAAYRTSRLQIVLARPGSASGAIAAPLVTPDGCFGALTAEIKDGGEMSDATQALATIFAAQLGTVLVDSASMANDEAPETRIASA